MDLIPQRNKLPVWIPRAYRQLTDISAFFFVAAAIVKSDGGPSLSTLRHPPEMGAQLVIPLISDALPRI